MHGHPAPQTLRAKVAVEESRGARVSAGNELNVFGLKPLIQCQGALAGMVVSNEERPSARGVNRACAKVGVLEGAIGDDQVDLLGEESSKRITFDAHDGEGDALSVRGAFADPSERSEVEKIGEDDAKVSPVGLRIEVAELAKSFDGSEGLCERVAKAFRKGREDHRTPLTNEKRIVERAS